MKLDSKKTVRALTNPSSESSEGWHATQNKGVEIDAKTPDKDPESKQEKVKHVHVGVFFDGTGNNMVAQAQSKSLKDKIKGGLKNVTDTITGRVFNNGEKNINKETNIDTEKEKEQLQNTVTAEYINNDAGHPYSNVAKLYSALNKYEDTEDNVYYNIYIEGCGGDNLADMSGVIDYNMSKAVMGCGFGVGSKGVASLVAKACHFITNYVSSIRVKLDENTIYHFYVFGFSRGSTCARLFCQLATREEKSVLGCEPELLKFARSGKMGSRMSFMERDSIVGLDIKRSNVRVEFLGIYDTVGSIGILQQIDTYINPLKDVLMGFDKTLECVVQCSANGEYSPDNEPNLHFRNVNDYGLFINYGDKKVRNVFHIGAADEYRENFAFTDIGNPGKHGCEIIIPGCHSDVGGSYVDYAVKERVLYRFIPRKAEDADAIVNKVVNGVQDAKKKLEGKINESEKLRLYTDLLGTTLMDIASDKKSINALSDTLKLALTPVLGPMAANVMSGASKLALTYHGLDPAAKRKMDAGVKSLWEIMRKRLINGASGTIAFIDPLNESLSKSLNAEGLSTLGWIDRYFYDDENAEKEKNVKKRLYLDKELKQPCTIRFVDNKNATKRCVKFNHNAKGNYSNIPLHMMHARCREKMKAVTAVAKAFRHGLFKEEYVNLFDIPEDLRAFGNKLVEIARTTKEGEKKWVTLGPGFFSDSYRLLRLKYLHFTASCQLVDWKLHWKILPEFDASNFGNECNYREDGTICRVRYEGKKGHISFPREGVKYLTASSAGFRHVAVNIAFSPQLYTKE